MRPPLPPLPIWGLLTPACAAGEKEGEWCFYSWTEPTEPIMYKQQGKYGDNRGLRPATTQGASDGFRLKTTGGLEVQGREGWRSKREPLQISLESLFSDISTVLVVLSFTCCFFYSPLSFFSSPPSSSFFGYSCCMSAPFSFSFLFAFIFVPFIL